MSRKGCPNKIQSGISYPRKCSECEYVSNNPSMYSYHKKTHDPIPAGQLCDHGCGEPAQYRGTGGVYSCSQVIQHCPGYVSKHSERVKSQWIGADSRRVATRETFLTHCSGVPEVLAKQKATLQKKWGNFTPEEMRNFRHYARRIRSRAQCWAKQEGHVLGQQTYHVDHKLSVWDAWHAGLSEEIVNHPANLQILEAKKNSSKGAKSQLTLDELMQLINSGV